MDEDFDDVSFYSKPRLKLATTAAKTDEDDAEGEPSQALKAAYCSVGVACIALGVCTDGVVQFFALWVALAFLIGPFSPLRVTGGNCCVGLGGDVEFDDDQEEQEPPDGPSSKGSKAPLMKKRGSSDALAGKLTNGVAAAAAAAAASASSQHSKGQAGSDAAKGGAWSRGEWDQLRGLLVKYPRGVPKRWENISRELKTKRSTEEVIAASKFMAECNIKDPFAAFAAQFNGPEKEALPPTPPAALAPQVAETAAPTSASPWTDAQDKALLKALKDHPKGDSERWDKVAQAVAGRSKAECQKRLAGLRDNLRAKKAAEGGVGDEDVDAL